MDLVYWRTEQGNFGDDLNLWLWDKLLPGWRSAHADVALVGVGTILKHPFLPLDRPKLVMGSGAGYGALPPMDQPALWDIRCVRGPRTARLLGLDPALAVVDPAVMVSDMAAFRDQPKSETGIFVPHFETFPGLDWDSIARRAGLSHVSPSQDSHAVIEAIARAPFVIAESMHAAIIADALRTPWTAISIGGGFNAGKWQDWGDSVGITVEIRPGLARLRRLQDLVRKVKTRRTAKAMPEKNREGTGTATRGTRPPFGAARPLIEAMLVQDLTRAAQAPRQLSRESDLEIRRTRLREICATVIRDYDLKAAEI